MHVNSTRSNPTRQPQSLPDGPDPIVRAAQRRRLERSHKHHKPAPKGERYGPLGGGTWIRPGSKRVRSDLEGWRLVDAVEWMAVRRFVPWSSADQSVLDELDVRTFSYTDLERRMVHSQASWLADVVRDQWCGDESPGFPRSGGFIQFMADLVHARRSHAVGLWISQVDAATLYGCSDRTFRRWMAHAENVKLVRVVQTWRKDDQRESSDRRWGKMLYMLGAAVIERAGSALYEGLELKLPDGKPMQSVSQRKARGLRRERKQGLRKRHDELWQVHRLTASQRKTIARNKRVESHPLIGPDIVSRPTRQSRETGEPTVPVVTEKQKTIAPTLPHMWTIPCGPQDGPTGEEVGPTGRTGTAAAPPWSGPSKRTTSTKDISYQQPPPGALSDASSGPLGGCATSGGTWQGGGDIGAMIAERMRNGFGGLLAMLLLFSGCAPTDSSRFLFFLVSCPVTSASDAQNKDGYAKHKHTSHPTDGPRGLLAGNHSQHTTDSSEGHNPDISGGHIPRHPKNQRDSRDPQRSRQAHCERRRRTAVHWPRWPARGHRGHSWQVARGAGLMDTPNKLSEGVLALLPEGILAFALRSNPPHNERDRISAYRLEMRELGALLSIATNPQLDAMRESFDLAMIDRGVNPRELPMVLAGLREKLGKIKK